LALSSAWAPPSTRFLPTCRKVVNSAVPIPQSSIFAASNQFKLVGGSMKRKTQLRMAGYVEQVDSEQFEIALQVFICLMF
jgi:hypothetical protein